MAVTLEMHSGTTLQAFWMCQRAARTMNTVAEPLELWSQFWRWSVYPGSRETMMFLQKKTPKNKNPKTKKQRCRGMGWGIWLFNTLANTPQGDLLGICPAREATSQLALAFTCAVGFSLESGKGAQLERMDPSCRDLRPHMVSVCFSWGGGFRFLFFLIYLFNFHCCHVGV